jgi:DNA-binding NtrC family response regulator
MTIPLRVLIVEDSEADALFALRELQSGGYEPTFRRVQKPAELVDALEKESWDIVLADFMVHQLTGPETILLVRNRKPDLPVVILSGQIGEDLAVEAVKAGADDYVMKDRLHRLVPVVRDVLQIAERRREQKVSEPVPLKVLIVEDSEGDAEILTYELENGGYRVESLRVDTAEAMQNALQTDSWDLIICDYLMPGFGGPEALALLKDSGLDLPFILISGKVGEEMAVAMMKAGAHDFVLKNKRARLLPAIERELSAPFRKYGREFPVS